MYNVQAFLGGALFFGVLIGAVSVVAGVSIDALLGDEFHPLKDTREWGKVGFIFGALGGLGRNTHKYYYG